MSRARQRHWSDDSNWTNGAPDAACITVLGTYVVTLDRRQALDGLVVGGTSGLQTLIMDGTLDPPIRRGLWPRAPSVSILRAGRRRGRTG